MFTCCQTKRFSPAATSIAALELHRAIALELLEVALLTMQLHLRTPEVLLLDALALVGGASVGIGLLPFVHRPLARPLVGLVLRHHALALALLLPTPHLGFLLPLLVF